MSLLCLYPVTGSTGLCKRNNEENNAARLGYRTNKRRQLLLQSSLHNLDFTAQCPHSLQLHCQWGEKLFWRSLTIARPRKKPHCTPDCNSKFKIRENQIKRKSAEQGTALAPLCRSHIVHSIATVLAAHLCQTMV